MNLSRPLVTLDIESTGLNPATDRIVSLAIAKRFPETPLLEDGAKTERRYWLVKPPFDIPQEAIDVHGITNEQVANCQPFSAVAAEIHERIKHCDIRGFGVWNFDLPLLWEEFYRAGIEWSIDTVRVIDASVIFKRKEERTLSAAVKFYCGREHESAHSADGDVIATDEVFAAQRSKYPDVAKMSRDELHLFCQYDNKRLDLAGKLALNEQGEPIYTFGQRTKGVRVLDDTGFGYWMLDKDFPAQTKMILRGILGPPPKDTPRNNDIPF